MKIALPTRNNFIDDHFGHCEYFTVMTFNEDGTEIIKKETIESPEGCGCKSNIAQILAEMGVSVMLAGNMGQGAVNVLNQWGIEVLRGCAGNVDEVSALWANGRVTDSGEACHQHGHDCQH